VTKDELLESECIALNWPEIVEFVATWIETHGPKHPGAKECAAEWREEMGIDGGR
jgi:hypothetical protein